MTELIIADTGPLIVLARINLLSQLAQLFQKVIVPEAVFNEACADLNKPGAKAISALEQAPWFQCTPVNLDTKRDIALSILDRGEMEVILLAQKLNCIALIDEKTGRRVAKNKGVHCIGTAAVLLKLKQEGLIGEVTPLLDKLADNGYRLSPALIKKVRLLANE